MNHTSPTRTNTYKIDAVETLKIDLCSPIKCYIYQLLAVLMYQCGNRSLMLGEWDRGSCKIEPKAVQAEPQLALEARRGMPPLATLTLLMPSPHCIFAFCCTFCFFRD
jgi:hypothetical protein